jgi:hypothetical protein
VLTDIELTTVLRCNINVFLMTRLPIAPVAAMENAQRCSCFDGEGYGGEPGEIDQQNISGAA